MTLLVYEIIISLYWCSIQIPVSFGVSGYEALCLYKGWRKIASKGDEGANLKVHQLAVYGLFGVLAGMVGGLLGLGGGFIMGPLFLELGVPPQVSYLSTKITICTSYFVFLDLKLLLRSQVPRPPSL